jgi:hypothetical protein
MEEIQDQSDLQGPLVHLDLPDLVKLGSSNQEAQDRLVQLDKLDRLVILVEVVQLVQQDQQGVLALLGQLVRQVPQEVKVQKVIPELWDPVVFQVT